MASGNAVIDEPIVRIKGLVGLSNGKNLFIVGSPPTVYFTSLLINQLIRVEVGVEDTYPFIILLELIPYAMISISAATGKLKKISDIILRVFCIALTLTSVVLALLSSIFSISIFSTDYISNTAGMICGFIAVFFIYMTMIELLKFAGDEKKPRQT